MPEDSESLQSADQEWLRKVSASRPASESRTLTASRKRLARLVVVGLVLVAACLLVRGPVGWFGAIFFGIGVLACAIQVIRPYQLVLTATGLEYRSPPRRPVSYDWTECGEFRLWSVQRTKLIVFASTRTDHRALRSANRLLAGGDASVQAAYQGIPAEQVVALLNSYRNRAVQRAGTAG